MVGGGRIVERGEFRVVGLMRLIGIIGLIHLFNKAN